MVKLLLPFLYRVLYVKVGYCESVFIVIFLMKSKVWKMKSSECFPYCLLLVLVLHFIRFYKVAIYGGVSRLLRCTELSLGSFRLINIALSDLYLPIEVKM